MSVPLAVGITTFRWHVLHTHEKRRCHLDSVKLLCGLSDKLPGVPPMQQFAESWKALREGKTSTSMMVLCEGETSASNVGPDDTRLPGPCEGKSSEEAPRPSRCEGETSTKGESLIRVVTSRSKCYNMWRCIYATMKHSNRKILAKEGTVVSLHRDEKARRIQVNFTACTPRFEARSGVLGVAFNQGGADGVNLATRKIIEDFFPKHNQRRQQFCTNVALLNVYSASDEIAACHDSMALLQKDSMTALRAAMFPNCRHIARDKAHGMHRLLKRSLAANPELNRIFTTFIFSWTSIVQKIDNSLQFHEWFLSRALHMCVSIVTP